MKKIIFLACLIFNYGYGIIYYNDHKQASTLARACYEGNYALVKKLAKDKAMLNPEPYEYSFFWDKPTPLMVAIEAQHLAIVQLLIALGADVNARIGCSQPHAGYSVLAYALEGQSLEILQEVLKAGAHPDKWIEGIVPFSDSYDVLKNKDINVRNNAPLINTISRSRPKSYIKALIDAGADVNHVDFYNVWTPLHIASYMGQEEIIQMLLSAGANKEYRNKYGKTAADLALEQGRMQSAALLF